MGIVICLMILSAITSSVGAVAVGIALMALGCWLEVHDRAAALRRRYRRPHRVSYHPRLLMVNVIAFSLAALLQGVHKGGG
jgi:hypothetical protein